jgi:hypothetical protein
MIKIPSKFTNLLNGLTDDISAAVGLAVTSVSPFLERNEAIFFPEYTDHGVNHIESVLNTCELMISEEAWNIFTREDVAVLILAVMTHDLGMLIDADGFRYLVDQMRNNELPIEANDEPWQKLWREFQLDVRRFDGPTLINILGSPEPVSMQELDPVNLTERSIKIIGEFLRRYHHRLAHEIIVYGIPSANGRVPLFNGVPTHLKDVAGRIARSHGIAIRECIESFGNLDRTAHRAYRYIHPTFLMTLVRLADYLDLDIGRAPSSILAAKSLKSPMSKREWWSHRAMLNCHSYDDDPECLYVVIEPSALPDVSTLSIVEEKLTGVQQELDSCWAVLGEVYGRFPPLNQLHLRIRRVRSDIHELSKISQLPYVPFKASLESTRADLLKLLIEPLYGDNPGIGVRELVQNAIDAVREFDFIVKEILASTSIDREPLDSDVVVSFEKDHKGDYWIKIADRGIGMTWQTVCKYYLTAGASFRQSGAWKRKFTDDSGETQVLRSGRFGIGVLAAFLLGDRVRVSTRHLDEPEDKGIEFEFGLDDTTIELRWKKRSVGTTVEVKTTEKVVEELKEIEYYSSPANWDRYFLEKPKLLVRDIDNKELKSKFSLPSFEDILPSDWHDITVPGFQAVNWTYRTDTPRLTCNGILIITGGSRGIDIEDHFEDDSRIEVTERFWYRRDSYLYLENPNVSVFDPDGRFPLNLARDNIASRPVKLEELLADDVARNFISFCLCKGPQNHFLSDVQFSSLARINYPGMDYNPYKNRPNWFYDTPHGFGLSDPYFINQYDSSPSLLLRIKGGNLKISKSQYDIAMNDYGYILGMQTGNTLWEFDNWYKALALSKIGGAPLPIFNRLAVKGFRIMMSDIWFERFITKQPKYIVRSLQVKSKIFNMVMFTIGDCPDEEKRLLSLSKDLKDNEVNVESVTECYISSEAESPTPGRIAKIWKEAIGGPIIPFDRAERQNIIERLDEKFKRHLEQWSGESIVKRRRRQ